ncbi:hypothetical protein [Nostoc sp.]|uniref:hypothetical protein n=1 Tax=Nostoc sp. TaxID=1180 RepID=UPI002FFBFF42
MFIPQRKLTILNQIKVWEATQHMIRELLDGAGNQGAANLRSQLGTIKEAARDISLSAV